MYITYIFIAITALVSIGAFNNPDLLHKLLMFPYGMKTPSEYYRLLTSGFVHGDWNHLIFNMITLYCFGQNVEMVLTTYYGVLGNSIYVFLYLSAIVLSSLPAMIKHKNHSYYRSLGASGGVSGVLFFAIYYFPWSQIRFMIIPIGIPAIIFGVLYSVYSAYMAKRGNDNIGHDAHLWGALYGFAFAFLADPFHGKIFLEQILHPRF